MVIEVVPQPRTIRRRVPACDPRGNPLGAYRPEENRHNRRVCLHQRRRPHHRRHHRQLRLQLPHSPRDHRRQSPPVREFLHVRTKCLQSLEVCPPNLIAQLAIPSILHAPIAAPRNHRFATRDQRDTILARVPRSLQLGAEPLQSRTLPVRCPRFRAIIRPNLMSTPDLVTVPQSHRRLDAALRNLFFPAGVHRNRTNPERPR